MLLSAGKDFRDSNLTVAFTNAKVEVWEGKDNCFKLHTRIFITLIMANIEYIVVSTMVGTFQKLSDLILTSSLFLLVVLLSPYY